MSGLDNRIIFSRLRLYLQINKFKDIKKNDPITITMTSKKITHNLIFSIDKISLKYEIYISKM